MNTIYNFNKQFLSKNSKFWKIIIPCITGYLIKQSYLKLNYDRISEFNNNIDYKIIDENDYIELREVGKGYSFQTVLINLIDDKNCY